MPLLKRKGFPLALPPTAKVRLIVGSSVKQDGVWSNPLDEARVRAVYQAFCQTRKIG